MIDDKSYGVAARSVLVLSLLLSVTYTLLDLTGIWDFLFSRIGKDFQDGSLDVNNIIILLLILIPFFLDFFLFLLINSLENPLLSNKKGLNFVYFVVLIFGSIILLTKYYYIGLVIYIIPVIYHLKNYTALSVKEIPLGLDRTLQKKYPVIGQGLTGLLPYKNIILFVLGIIFIAKSLTLQFTLILDPIHAILSMLSLDFLFEIMNFIERVYYGYIDFLKSFLPIESPLLILIGKWISLVESTFLKLVVTLSFLFIRKTSYSSISFKSRDGSTFDSRLKQTLDTKELSQVVGLLKLSEWKVINSLNTLFMLEFLSMLLDILFNANLSQIYNPILSLIIWIYILRNLRHKPNEV